MIRARLVQICSVLCKVASAVLLLAIVLRVVGYDQEGWLLAFHYATPWPVVAAGAATVAAVAIWCAPMLPIPFALVALVCAGVWAKTSWKQQSPQPGAEAARTFAYWNVAGPQARLPQVIAQTKKLRTDFLAIGEVGDSSPKAQERWATAFEGCAVRFLSGEILVATRGTIRQARFGSLRKGRYNLIDLELDRQAMRVVLVDFDADLTRPRRPAFEALEELVQTLQDEPLVVMGDFNTPADSPHFAMLRGGLVDAWESAGSGYSASWPVPLPVLRLDYIYLSHSLEARRYSQDWSMLSDHRAQRVELVVNPKRPALGGSE